MSQETETFEIILGRVEHINASIFFVLFFTFLLSIIPFFPFTVAMSARLVQHLSCLLILIHKVKELIPILESDYKGIDLF
jgi:hypothetical protein